MRDDLGLPRDDREQQPSAEPSEGLSALMKALGFAASGGLAFLTDALTLETLVSVFEVPPAIARAIAIALAMVVGWFSHRTLTFRIARPPSISEFVRYAGVAWVAAAVNYTIFLAILWLLPDVRPLGALVVASLLAMIVSYVGMKFGVFRQPPPGGS